MANGSENQQEAVAVRLGALSTKTKTRIGFWNVRTMFSTGRLAQITREINEIRLHFLGISECRWTGFGSQKTPGGETILFSGRNDNLHRKPINERLIRAWFFGKQMRMTVI